MPHPFYTLDVFTTQRLAGNPLAVVLDAADLDTARMQGIAREFNLSETVFVLPPEDASQKARIRIFTPNFEMPFAGHPTIGTAVLLATLATNGNPGDDSFVLGENVGPIACRTTVVSPTLGRAAFDVAMPPARIGEIGPRAKLAAALSVPESAIGFPGALSGIRPGVFSAGAAFAIVPFASPEALDAAAPSRGDWPPAFGMNDRQSVFMVAPTAVPGTYHARMFAFGRDIYEDPATGSATAAVAALLAEAEVPGDGSHKRIIQQGYAMGRPSQIELTYHIANGEMTGATIGGSAILVSQGQLL